MNGNLYNHDPRHWRFVRSTQCFEPIEDCGASRRDRWVFWIAAIIALVLVVVVAQ